MAFKFSENHIDEFQRHGYTVFKQIIPNSLLRDLRNASDMAREIARKESGPQVQRLQPVASYDMDQRPFIDFGELPELVDAVARVLTPVHRPSSTETLGILLEPAEMPYSTMWHRDWRDNARVDGDLWREAFDDINYFNQTNCPLYEDSSLWYVPGSHLRLDDLPGESELFPIGRPTGKIDFPGRSAEERERLCLEYTRSMPGAIQLHLEAGDYALYRPTAWHIGNYVPYIKRATLHDHVSTPNYDEWRKKAMASMDRAY
jgi:ectoine hydroxylase-related dioxygenase (phytanoyl-CoA dioxygenase family)